MFYKSVSKPCIDKCIAIISIVLLAPVFLLISLVNYTLYKNIFFIQERAGYHLKPFQLIKFQTMKTANDLPDNIYGDVHRITPFGKILRITALDELPQLFHVLTGVMSLVGPRPLPVSYNTHYTETQLQRFNARPGITGLAQVNGRNTISWEERFQFDVTYCKTLSFRLDLFILIKTVVQLLKVKEANASEFITMKPFKK